MFHPPHIKVTVKDSRRRVGCTIVPSSLLKYPHYHQPSFNIYHYFMEQPGIHELIAQLQASSSVHP
jgi:hypothetical protein